MFAVRPRALAAALLTLACAACGAGRRQGPRLVALDSVVLAESDTTFIGKPSGFVAGDDGRFYVTDVFARRVLVFGHDGRLERVIGHRGNGPGEFAMPTWLALGGDSLLYVVDNGTSVEAFDPRSGAFRWGRRLGGPVSMLTSHEGRLLVGYPDSLRRTSVAVLTPDTSSLAETGPLPALLEKNPIVRGLFGSVEMAAFRDTLATVYEVSDRVYLSRLEGGVLDSIEVPAVRRRGSRPELLGRITRDPQSARDVVYQLSMPGELARLSSGLLALVSFDWKWTSSRVQGTGFVSLVDPARRRSCPDTRLPGPSDPIPRVAFRGDTLWVLAQEIEGERPYTVLRAYRVDGKECQWLSSAE